MLKSRVILRMAPSWTKSADLARNRSEFPLETRKSHSFFRKPNDERRTLGYSGAEIPVKPSGVKSRSVKATSCLIRGAIQIGHRTAHRQMQGWGALCPPLPRGRCQSGAPIDPKAGIFLRAAGRVGGESIQLRTRAHLEVHPCQASTQR
jgi:hypothetical protein